MEFDIAVFYREDMDKQEVLNFADELRDIGASVITEERDNVPYVSLDWAIPAFIVAYLAKPYIEAILEEAAKDHYPVIKRAFTRFADKHLKRKGQKFISSTSSNKGKTNIKVSQTFAIWSTTVDGRSIKFLFEEDKEKDLSQLASSVDKIFDTLAEHIRRYPSDSISLREDKAASNTREFYMLFDEALQEWIAFDINTERPLGE